MDIVEAVTSNRIDIVRELLEEGVDPSVRSIQYHDTPLIIACRYNDNTEMIRLLLDHGTNPNITNDLDNTALSVACIYRYTDIVRLLLQRGANPNIRNNNSGDTPLIIACVYQHVDMIRLLLDSGADPNVRDPFNRSPYTLAKEEEIRMMIREVIAKHGKSIYQMNDRSREYMSSIYSDISIVICV